MTYDTCHETLIDEARVSRARKALPDDGTTEALSEIFKALGDPTRIRLLSALATCELCVCDLAALTGVSSSAISHQLRLLRAARLVRYRREGKMAYYSLDDDHVRSLIDEGLKHVNEG